MKKSYVKPQVCFESFQLSASIAATCGQKIGPTEGTCAYPASGMVLFMTGMDACETQITKDDDGKFYPCYHVPSADKLFTSA